LLDSLSKAGIKDTLWLHGATQNRGEVVAEFQKPDGPRVIVVSLKAGGTGITLTAADTIIYYDPWWNPAVMDQAADRAHRIGQTKTVHLIKLVCHNSIEEQILALCEKKRAVADDVLLADRAGQRSLTLDDIRQLLQVEIDRDL
jgi:SNF2 family DNA or RNA helicase